jgi:hypothetical protein
MIKERLLAAGFSSRTVRRYLPQEAKQEQIHSKKAADKMSTYHQDQDNNNGLKPENYQTEALEYYYQIFSVRKENYFANLFQISKPIVHSFVRYLTLVNLEESEK